MGDQFLFHLFVYSYSDKLLSKTLISVAYYISFLLVTDPFSSFVYHSILEKYHLLLVVAFALLWFSGCYFTSYRKSTSYVRTYVTTVSVARRRSLSVLLIKLLLIIFSSY